jgi:type II secretory ATPase GspE/PulE/Tfp pilus assembly ATPase PilB-like protein
MDLPEPLTAAIEAKARQKTLSLTEGQGCATCRQTGYAGRTGVFELMTIEPDVHAAILRRATADELHSLAVKHGMNALMDDGARLISEGVTTPTEVMRAIG